MRNSFISLFRLIAILIKFNLHSDLKIVYIYNNSSIELNREQILQTETKKKLFYNSFHDLHKISLSLSSLREKCIDLEKYIGVTIVTLIVDFFLFSLLYTSSNV